MSKNIIKSYLLKSRCHLCGYIVNILEINSIDYGAKTKVLPTINLKHIEIGKNIIDNFSNDCPIALYSPSKYFDKLIKKSSISEQSKLKTYNHIVINNLKSYKCSFKEYLCSCNNCGYAYFILLDDKIKGKHKTYNKFYKKY